MGLGDGNVYNSATEEDLRKVITYHPYYPRVGPMRDFPGGSKNPPAMWETWVLNLWVSQFCHI